MSTNTDLAFSNGPEFVKSTGTQDKRVSKTNRATLSWSSHLKRKKGNILVNSRTHRDKCKKLNDQLDNLIW